MWITHSLLLVLQIIAAMVAATLTVIAIMVIGSYTIRRYELGNRESADTNIGDTVPAIRRVLGMVGEVGAVFLCVLLYPFGYIVGEHSRARLRQGERAVILCHGYMGNRSSFFVLRYALMRAGYYNVIFLNFRPSSASIPYFAQQLSEVVKFALSRTRCDKVDLLGHSMGGLIVRYFIEKLDGARCVNTAITLGTPHHGTKTAALGLFKTAEQFRPDSAFIRELNKISSSLGSVNMIAIWSDFDNIVLPPENARLPEPCENQMVTGVGHMAFLFSRQVFSKVRLALCERSKALRYEHDKAGNI